MTNDVHPQSWARLIQRSLILFLVCLAFVTAYQVYRHRQPDYQVQVFQTPGGWGYDILNDEQTVIHQPTIPGQSGIVGFSSQTQARRVGEWVAEQVKQRQALPTLTNKDLRHLGVSIP